MQRRQDSEQNMEDARLARELQREEEEFFARQIQSDSSDTSNLRQNRSAMKCGHCGNRINSRYVESSCHFHRRSVLFGYVRDFQVLKVREKSCAML